MENEELVGAIGAMRSGLTPAVRLRMSRFPIAAAPVLLYDAGRHAPFTLFPFGATAWLACNTTAQCCGQISPGVVLA